MNPLVGLTALRGVSADIHSGEIVALVKPQFEVGRGKVGRGGVVRDPALHREVLERRVDWVLARGWGVAGLVLSSLTGADGNREFFLQLRPDGPGLNADDLARRLTAAVEPASGKETPW